MAIDLVQRELLGTRSLVVRPDHALILVSQSGNDRLQRVYYDRISWFTAQTAVPLVGPVLITVVALVAGALLAYNLAQEPALMIVLVIDLLFILGAWFYAFTNRKLALVIQRGERTTKIKGLLSRRKATALIARLDHAIRNTQRAAEEAAIQRYLEATPPSAAMPASSESELTPSPPDAAPAMNETEFPPPLPSVAPEEPAS